MREKLIEIFKRTNYKQDPNLPDTMTANLANQFTEYALNSIAEQFIENGVVVKECGKWANAYSSGTHLYRCTECGEYIEAIWTGGYDFKYCPNCGVRMEEM